MSGILKHVARMPYDTVAQRFLDSHGLRAHSTTWEDTARDKNSSVGNNISDMTLRAEGSDMPVIRPSNREDVTFDVPVKNIILAVGNELGEEKRKVGLEEYLTHFPHYLNQPLKYQGKSLFVPTRDTNVLMSAQACMLPLSLNDQVKTKFVVALRNYQSRKNAPAVLVLVATDDGTSAHVINTNNTELLYFNKNGERCPLLAERLGAYRVSQGRADDGSAMNAEERAKNVIMVIQIPLKQKTSSTTWANLTGLESASLGFGGGSKKGKETWGSFDLTESQGHPPKMNVAAKSSGFSFGSETPKAPETQQGFFFGLTPPAKKEESPESDDMGFDLFGNGETHEGEDQRKVENAIVTVGEPEGPFDELCGQSIERDPQYPIRVTMQYYYATTTGTLDLDLARQISTQIRDTQTQYGAVAVGSLVINDKTGRTTEATKSTAITPWWPMFLETYGPKFLPLYSSSAYAAEVLFKNGRFLRDGMSEVAQKALEILVKNGEKSSA